MMRIISYNVRYFSHSVRGLMPTRRSLQKIAAAFASLDAPPEILCLQEVRSEQTLVEFRDALNRASSRRYRAAYFPAHTGALYSTGLAVLTDSESLTATAEDSHALTADGDPGERRICAHLELRLGEHTLHVFNVHLSLPSPLFGTRLGHGQNQLRQAVRLSELVRERAYGQPYILCGDFNAHPLSPVERHLAGGAIPPTMATAGIGPLRMRLDYLFSGNGLHWLDSDGTHAFGDRQSHFYGLSDHVPLIARFRLAGH